MDGIGKGLPIETLRYGDDDLDIHGKCERTKALNLDWRKRLRKSLEKSLELFQPTLAKLNEGRQLDPRDVKIREWLDYVDCAKAQGNVPYPSELDDPALMTALRKVVTTRAWGFLNSREALTLGLGRLMSDLRLSMAQKVKEADQDPLRLRIFAAGQPTLAGSLIALDCYDGHLPGFTASLTFELYKRTPDAGSAISGIPQEKDDKTVERASVVSAPKPEHYVRAIYQDKPLTPPACAKPGKHYPGHPELCTFQAFSDIVKAITPKNWSEDCKKTGPMPWAKEGLLFL